MVLIYLNPFVGAALHFTEYLAGSDHCAFSITVPSQIRGASLTNAAKA